MKGFSDDDNFNRLFKLVFNNKVIFKIIYKYSRLYKKNEIKKFNGLKELREYPDKEYINEIVLDGYQQEIINEDDFPNNGVLKKVKLNFTPINGNVIPDGVEILEFSSNLFAPDQPPTPFSTLPSSIHTIINAEVIQQSLLENKVKSTCWCSNIIGIPSNITSISFNRCINISGIGDIYHLELPNTIRELKFNRYWDNDKIKLIKGNIPEGITNLSLGNYTIANLKKGILPNSIKELEITCKDNEYSNDKFGFLPPKIEILSIWCYCILNKKSNLIKFRSIKKLTIELNRPNGEIKSDSLPPSITDLEISGIYKKLENNVIPNSVIKLKLQFENSNGNISEDCIPNSVFSLSVNKLIDENDKLPISLTHLELNYYGDVVYSDFKTNNEKLKEKVIQTLSKLPTTSISSITLPKSYIKFNLQFAATIKKINYS